MKQGMENWKISKTQIREILALYEKLKWKISDLEKDLGRSLEDMFWLQGISIINGAKSFLPEDYKDENVEITI